MQPPRGLAGRAGRTAGDAGADDLRVSRNFTGRFLPNQPVYYLYGDSDQAAKFQFSFDYRSATFEAGKSEPTTSVRSLRLGYTQRSLWDLDGDSSPFYDTSYMPEIAIYSDRRMPERVSSLFTFAFWLIFRGENSGAAPEDQREKGARRLEKMFGVMFGFGVPKLLRAD